MRAQDTETAGRNPAAEAKRPSVPPAKLPEPCLDGKKRYPSLDDVRKLNRTLIEAFAEKDLDAGKIKRLLSSGAEPYARNNDGVLLKEIAKKRGGADIVKLFEEAEAALDLEIKTAF
jgi:ankyrin repeat protein